MGTLTCPSITSRRAVAVALVGALGACANPPPPATPISGLETQARLNAGSDYRLIPYPARLSPGSGTFQLGGQTAIQTSHPDDASLRALADYAAAVLHPGPGIRLTVAPRRATRAEAGVIALLLDEGVGDPESYRLEVTQRSVTLRAPTHAGLFHGVQTLRQLAANAADESGSGAAAGTTIPAVRIEDAPRFPYRGMHLDVARHYFPVSFIKKYIDLLAAYKMNTFHWHLTDDQGWRIEIEKYPRLTEVAAYRKETILERNFDPYVGDRIPYGGYYTQDEVREVVSYAAERYVTVIPEIEMPGHSTAALAAYPELACTEGPFEVTTVWGVHEDIYCPSEATFRFLEGVLAEVMELFPSRYIHIGGDEAPKRRWRESRLAQEIIRQEGLADEEELQSWFIQRIGRFLAANGRRLIGWDEILEGGLTPGATVMSWRGTAGGIEAAREGNDVIMTPTSHVYFDYYQGDPTYEPLAIGGLTTLERVYAFEPVPAELDEEEARHVLGAQGNVWTEYMKTGDHVEYMVIPRMLALAEVVWSPKGARDWDRFVAALPAHFDRLGRLGYVYRVPPVRGLETDKLTLQDSITVRLSSLLSGVEIRFTLDGSDPGLGSHLYDGPIVLPVDEDGVMVTARVYLEGGRASPPRGARFARTALLPALEIAAEQLAPGLRYRYVEGRFSSVEELEDAPAAREGIVTEVGLSDAERDEEFGLLFDGYLLVPASGIYTFYLTSDDGSDLRVAGVSVIDNDGPHGPTERSGQIALEAGVHAIAVRYFQAGGGKTLDLMVAVEGEPRRRLGVWLHHER